jgi:hypothetical protein
MSDCLSAVLNQRPLDETKDCGVITLAIVCDVPYADAYAALAKSGRRPCGPSGQGMYDHALRLLGYKRFRYPVRSRTIRSLERELPAGPRFMVHIRGHVLAFRHGKPQDGVSGGRLFRVKCVYQIVKL